MKNFVKILVIAGGISLSVGGATGNVLWLVPAGVCGFVAGVAWVATV